MFDPARANYEGMVEKSGWFLDNFGQRSRPLTDLHPTTRCFPRSLTDAFPNSVERAEWWYPPEKTWNAWDFFVGGFGLFLWIQIAYLLAE